MAALNHYTLQLIISLKNELRFGQELRIFNRINFES